MVKKAVIPAAGFGTRFLPATKSQPKEMLPIVDTPTIQHVVQEAVNSGITDILMVIGKSKRAIEEHFDRSFELEMELEAKGRMEELQQIRDITKLANIHFIWQKELRGLGDAVLYAKDHVGDQPFALLLGDTLIGPPNSAEPVTRQLIEVFERYQEPVVGLEEVAQERVGRYGVAGGKFIDDNLLLLDALVEKPKPEEAPSNLAISGRYVFTAKIFDFLEKTQPGQNNEIQLTDAMRAMLASRAMYGLRFKGVRYDIGNKLDFVRTNVIYGLAHKDIAPRLREFIKEIARDL